MKKKKTELLKEKLKEASEEILELKLEAKKHRCEKDEFDRMIKKWDSKISSVSKSMDNAKRMLKRTQPLRLVVKDTRKMNLHLQAENISLKFQVEDLQEQLDLIQEELEKKGLRMKVVEEPIGQPIMNEDETPKD